MIKRICSNLNFSEPEPRRLGELEEVRDILLQVIESENQCIAIYGFGAVSMPGELAERLRELVGHKIAILRFDNIYRIRNLDG